MSLGNLTQEIGVSSPVLQQATPYRLNIRMYCKHNDNIFFTKYIYNISYKLFYQWFYQSKFIFHVADMLNLDDNDVDESFDYTITIQKPALDPSNED